VRDVTIEEVMKAAEALLFREEKQEILNRNYSNKMYGK
jgi:hypothetical protein